MSIYRTIMELLGLTEGGEAMTGVGAEVFRVAAGLEAEQNRIF